MHIDDTQREQNFNSNLPLPGHEAAFGDISLNLKHGEIRVWDNWYCKLPANYIPKIASAEGCLPEVREILSGGGDVYLLGYLNAPREYYDGKLGPNQHHFHSRLGTALTRDFVRFVRLSDSALIPTPQEGSIWSGSFFFQSLGAKEDALLFLYTSRSNTSPFGLSQEIRLAGSNDCASFFRLPGVLTPDPRWYVPHTIPGDTSIHAFRDPFPFKIGDQCFALISAKSRLLPYGRVGGQPGENGVIAVYRLFFDGGALRGEATPLCFAAGTSEMEVPSVYWDVDNSRHVFCFSTHTREDYARRTSDTNGLPVGAIDEKGEFLEFSVQDFSDLLKDPPEIPVQVTAHPVMGSAPRSYANRIVPECGGRILGFNLETGLPTLGSTARSSVNSL